MRKNHDTVHVVRELEKWPTIPSDSTSRRPIESQQRRESGVQLRQLRDHEVHRRIRSNRSQPVSADEHRFGGDS